MKKIYSTPFIQTLSQSELEDLIQAGACSSNFTCHCHSGSNNSG